MVRVRVLRSPRETELGAKLLENPGRSVATMRSSVAVPLLPSDDVRSPVALGWVPTVLAVTSTVTADATSPG